VTIFVVTSAVKIDLTTFISGVLFCLFLPISGKIGTNHKNQAVNLRKKGKQAMERKKTFLVVCLTILFAGDICAQVSRPGSEKAHFSPGELKRTPPGNMIVPKPVFFPTATPANTLILRSSGLHVLESDFYSRHFGFFCRKELLFEKTTRIPLRFRLGSLEYCNELEHGPR
jgi:hypothetical protein